jgi:hypothetical protein
MASCPAWVMASARPLEKTLQRGPVQPCPHVEVASEALEGLVEPRHLIPQVRERLGPVGPTDEERPGVGQDAVHVAHELLRRPDLGSSPKRAERLRGTPEGFLGAVGHGCEKVAQELPTLGREGDSSPDYSRRCLLRARIWPS